MPTEREQRDAIDQTAAQWRRTVERAGGSCTQEQARERVAQAVRRGDAKRGNGNR
ncbi:MAG: hypothetical protein AAF211_23820 [Myxococcota bacterium]